MKLSIIIVNYNVRYFLDQCLRSVERAIEGIDADVWVVDNKSSDDSMQMVAQKYPWVKRIENEENVGFSTANNQAANASDSDYVLLLNPDTIVPEDNFKLALEYMEQNQKCGALGIKMHDGSGHFLPESKRGLPTPWVAFYKIFGLSSLFPKSERFARYHLGHLDEKKNQRVEILAGAYMLMRRDAWEKSGGLDESYFMYGEDIDLSYCIEKAGFEVHYFADSPIIHYKGESTKKGSMNYVFMFYNAMLIFANKHLSKGYARTFGLLIRFAIYLRAGLSLAKRFVQAVSLPVIDVVLFSAGMQAIIRYWELNHRFIEGGSYPDIYKWGITPAYGLLWVLGMVFVGGYRKPIQLNRILVGLVLGSGLIFGMYALSPEDLRFSRALILLGAAWMSFAILFIRFALSFFPSYSLGLWQSGQRRVIFVGYDSNANSVKSLLRQDTQKVRVFKTSSLKEYITYTDALDANEVIFDGEMYSYKEIISNIVALENKGIKIQIAYPKDGWMIGSDSLNTRGKAILDSSFALSSKETLRSKRTFDIAIVSFLWILTPIAIWMPRLNKLWWNSFAVLFAQKTWVGYGGNGENLPRIKTGVVPVKQLTDTQLQVEADTAYAQNADVNIDARTLIRFLRRGK